MDAVLISPGMDIIELNGLHCTDGYVPKGGGHCGNGNNPGLRNTCGLGYIPDVLP